VSVTIYVAILVTCHVRVATWPCPHDAASRASGDVQLGPMRRGRRLAGRGNVTHCHKCAPAAGVLRCAGGLRSARRARLKGIRRSHESEGCSRGWTAGVGLPALDSDVNTECVKPLESQQPGGLVARARTQLAFEESPPRVPPSSASAAPASHCQLPSSCSCSA
jgi:hypothetical protein